MQKEVDMVVIGITGGIGSGKSTILDYFRKLELFCVVEADKLAHGLMQPGEKAYHEIVKIFGTGILDETGTIDRAKLGAVVYADPEALAKLNAIVHPAVKEYIIRDIEIHRNGNTRFYVIEAALLIEDGYRAICDELWYIFTDQEERIRRLVAGRGGSREKWERVIANQSPESYYRANCDVVIDNGKDVDHMKDQVKKALQRF